jgi:phosphoribosylaminoimidazole-succinocarboxamide synthase
MTAAPSGALDGPRIDEFPLWRRGKVRDVYDLGDRLLLVASDRISAFDVVLPTRIPDKGRALTQISLFWFRHLEGVVANHVLSGDVRDLPKELWKHESWLEGRSMLVKRTAPLPVECVVRGWLAGSGFKDYARTGAICGVALPKGLRESDRLPEPIFTPATKAETGHDENIDFARAEAILGRARAIQARDLSLAIYDRARRHAESVGIVIADTKFEFGLRDDFMVWIDEALTPDSSRFWSAGQITPGASPPSFDKQFVRNYLETLDWNKTAPGPALPEDVVRGTRERYLEAGRLLTGRPLL